jgi:Na+/H+-dicarboxylate symporter
MVDDELGKGRGLGKVAGRSLMFTLLLSSRAVIIAVVLTVILQPGAGLSFDKNALASAPHRHQSFKDLEA